MGISHRFVLVCLIIIFTLKLKLIWTECCKGTDRFQKENIFQMKIKELGWKPIIRGEQVEFRNLFRGT